MRNRSAVLVVVSETLCREFFSDTSRTLLLDAAAVLGGCAPLRIGSLSGDIDPGGVQVLVTSWGFPRLDAELLDRMPSLGLVAHTGGASIRSFVTEEVFARGIRVTQAGQAMAPAVAEVSLMFTLVLLHRVHRMDHAMRDGAWPDTTSFGTQHELAGSVVTVVGASRTGRAYLSLLHTLGAHPLIVDPTLPPREAARLGAELVPLEEGLRRARIVALHAPSLPETRHLLGARELALMPDGAGLVNTARSHLVDGEALLAEVRSGRLDAAIDVFDEEPLPPDSELRTLPNVVTTPHRAAGTHEGRLRQGQIVAEEVHAWVHGLPLLHGVDAHHLHLSA